jgi:hypothetical protein
VRTQIRTAGNQPEALPVRQIDSEQWEDAAQALLDGQRKPFDIPLPGAG